MRGISAGAFQVSDEQFSLCGDCGMYGDSDTYYVDSGVPDDQASADL
jgi:hypothetical protein